MEQFKELEAEAKTKPHSKKGLSTEEKQDPVEKEKQDAIEWVNVGSYRWFLKSWRNEKL